MTRGSPFALPFRPPNCVASISVFSFRFETLVPKRNCLQRKAERKTQKTVKPAKAAGCEQSSALLSGSALRWYPRAKKKDRTERVARWVFPDCVGLRGWHSYAFFRIEVTTNYDRAA